MASAKKKQSPNARAASMKNLAKHESAQDERARVSNDKEVFESGYLTGVKYANHMRFAMGLVFGSVVTLVAGFIGLYISMNV